MHLFYDPVFIPLLAIYDNARGCLVLTERDGRRQWEQLPGPRFAIPEFRCEPERFPLEVGGWLHVLEGGADVSEGTVVCVLRQLDSRTIRYGLFYNPFQEYGNPVVLQDGKLVSPAVP